MRSYGNSSPRRHTLQRTSERDGRPVDTNLLEEVISCDPRASSSADFPSRVSGTVLLVITAFYILTMQACLISI